MSKKLPLRISNSVLDLHLEWQVSRDEIGQWLAHGDLNANIWLPITSVYEVTEEVECNRIILTRRLCHQEGYMQLFPHDCRKLLSLGQLELRHFSNSSGYPSYSLPEAAHGFFAQVSDLVILEGERLRFEQAHGLGQSVIPRANGGQGFDLTFRRIHYDGQTYQFGPIQAAILRKLFDAASVDTPWLNGKQLLAQVGSQSYTLANVFKRRPVWRELIHSDQRGYYRLQPQFLESFSSNGRGPLDLE